jgi:hypothetical protein
MRAFNFICNDIKLNEAHAPGAINSVRQALEIGLVGQALHDINSFELKVENTPGLEELLNKYKDVILKFILTKFKDSLGFYGNCMFIVGLIDRLKHTNINWSEIQIIEKSIQIEVKRILGDGLRLL